MSWRVTAYTSSGSEKRKLHDADIEEVQEEVERMLAEAERQQRHDAAPIVTIKIESEDR